jgi:hypothetical protein
VTGPGANRVRITRSFLPLVLAAASVAGCSNGSASPASTAHPTTSVATHPTTTTSATEPPTTTAPVAPPHAVDPNAPEVVEPGDIPDNQVFVPYRPSGASFQVKVPEGWAQTGGGAATTFTDHYNSITIAVATATHAPSTAEVRSSGLTDVEAGEFFALGDVSTVQRHAGPAVGATYETGSDPNPVTGKRALLAVERYVFFHAGTLVTLTLSGAKGADNVDPWRTVTDSLTWG